MFRIHKVWQLDKNRLLWLLHGHGKQKVFMSISLAGAKATIYFCGERPAENVKVHAFNEILRKHCTGMLITSITTDRNGQYLLQMTNDRSRVEAVKGLHVTSQPEMLIDLFDTESRQSVARLSPQSCFTKRKPIDSLPLAYEATLAIELEKTPTPEEKSVDPSSSSLGSEQRKLRDQLRRRLKTLKKSLAKKSQRTITPEGARQMEQEARLLSQYAYLVKPEAFELVIPSELSGLSDAVTISLDPEISVGENLNRRYTELKRMQRGLFQSQDQLRKHEKAMAELEQDIEALHQRELSPTEIRSLRLKHQIPEEQVKPEIRHEERLPFTTFVVEDYVVKVGKGGADNDALSKSARSNDLWTHAVGASGAHVIVESKRTGEFPPLVIRAAAILAIHYSKRRKDLASEVYVTKRSGIRKKKGMPVGLWNVENAKTEFIRYTEDELKRILDALKPTS